MLALIMAGGEGRRLNFGEKPLISLAGRPMVSWVIDAFREAGCDPVIVASSRTPITINWCRVQGIEYCTTGGMGYIEDMIEAVRILEVDGPLFVSVSDIPCVNTKIIATIEAAYHSAGKDACSTWIPSVLVKSSRNGMPYREQIQGTEACPAGINVLRGDHIAEPQEELQLLLNEPRLAINVNTRADRDEAELFLRTNAS
jgi:adenosylcobinamide-phosphate guanylyltransferase